MMQHSTFSLTRPSFSPRVPVRVGVCGRQSDTRTQFFPITSVLPRHWHSIHILTLHTHLFIVSLYTLS